MRRKNSLSDYIRESLSKIWGKGRARCLSCGHEWNSIYLNLTKDTKFKIQCPKCGARNSTIISDEFVKR